VQRADGTPAFLDFAYPERALAIETDGNGSHATPAQRSADNVRSNQLPGWRFLRFTYEDVTERPDAVAAVVARNLRT
jgi:very-short-patch-repair endonuclease